MNKNKMDNGKSEKISDQQQGTQISIELEREVTDYVLNKTKEDNIIDSKELVNVEVWKKRYKNLKNQAKVFHNVVKQFDRDLKKHKFTQQQRCITASGSQNVDISCRNKLDTAILHGNSNKEIEIFTISSDNEDEPIITTDLSKIKLILTKNDNINLIDSESDNNSKNLNVKYKPCPKSKKNVSMHYVKVNGTNKVMPLNTELGKCKKNVKRLSTTMCSKRKPGPKSKTMFVDDMIPFNSKNKEHVEKKNCLNKLISDKKSKTKNLSNSYLEKKLKITKKHDFHFEFSSSKYPPPYPLIPPYITQPSWKNVPPAPNMKIKTSGNKVTLTWDLNLSWQIAKIKMYEIFVCQETDAHPDISMWKKKGNIKSDMLPMACELEIFELGYVYHFALRAVDVHNRRAPFAVHKTKI